MKIDLMSANIIIFSISNLICTVLNFRISESQGSRIVMIMLYVSHCWFDLYVDVVGDNPHKSEECYANWGACNSSLASTRLLHMVGSNSKYAKVKNEWNLKSIQASTLIDHSRQCKPDEDSKSSWENYKKVNTIIYSYQVYMHNMSLSEV